MSLKTNAKSKTWYSSFKAASQTAPYSLHSALLSTRAHGTLVKSSALLGIGCNLGRKPSSLTSLAKQ